MIFRLIPFKRGLLFYLSFTSSVFSLDLFISPEGNDKNSGEAQSPLASIAEAQKRLRSSGKLGAEVCTVTLADGVYYLSDPIVFTAQDSGSAQFPVTYKAQNEAGAVLSGGQALSLEWQPHQDGIYKATTPSGLKIDQLFINGENQRMARYPNYDPKKTTSPYQGYSKDAFAPSRAAGWANPEGGYIHAMHIKRWGGYHYRITGKDANNKVSYEGGWQNNRKMGMHESYRMVENIFEELDAPQEWFHNAAENTLYYQPAEGVDLSAAEVVVVRLPHLVEFQGTEQSSVKHITLEGFTVRHAARTFMDCKEQLLRSDWAIYRGGAFLLTGTEGVQILDCEFDQVGGNGIFVNMYNRNTLIKGCHIHHTGASGVCFVGDPQAVRDPLFEYNETQDLTKIDRTPGPKTNNYPADCTVEDCLIHKIGTVERQPAGVQISMSMGITVRDCSIYDCARAGINVSEGTWGGHLIEGVDVFDTVMETHDHGSFNSWGRDRFWHKKPSETQRVYDGFDQLPFLDAVKTTVIRNSRWRCDHGWDIDLDDGSTNYTIYNNLMLSRGLKLREGFGRTVYNNITVNNGLHPHVWYQKSKDQVYGNIFMTPHKPARLSGTYTDETMVDKNLYFATPESVMRTSQKLGWDANSVFGDPLFIDAASGNFQVSAASPALQVGFENFPMDQFGVKKPALKRLARTPLIDLPTEGSAAKKSPYTNWYGSYFSDIKGDMFSAYGISQEDGGVVLQNHSMAGKLQNSDLQIGDVILSINGTAIKSTADLKKVSKLNGTVDVLIVRDQSNSTFKITL